MYYPEISPLSVFNRFKDEFHWVSFTENASDKPFSVQNHLPLIQSLNPLRSAWFNLIADVECQYLANTRLSDILPILSEIKALDGVLIFCANAVTQLESLLQELKTFEINCFCTAQPIEKILPILSAFLYRTLSPQCTYHGTLVEVFGHGVLLTGPSGIGKSQTALYCLERGHYLIADDAPSLLRFGNQIIGECPPSLEGLLEIRQLGILQVSQQFSHLSIKKQHSLDLIIQLNKNITLERNIELTVDLENIFGLDIPKIQLAFSQDIAILVEHAIRLLNRPT